MPMDYSYLRGKIIENCKSNYAYAKKIGISNTELSNKLNNKSSFTQKQISDSIKILNLNENDIMKCFFYPLGVENNSTN